MSTDTVTTLADLAWITAEHLTADPICLSDTDAASCAIKHMLDQHGRGLSLPGPDNTMLAERAAARLQWAGRRPDEDETEALYGSLINSFTGPAALS